MVSSLLFWLSGFVVGWAMRSFVLFWRSRRNKQAVASSCMTPELRQQRSRARIRAGINRQIEAAIDPDFDPDTNSVRRS